MHWCWCDKGQQPKIYIIIIINSKLLIWTIKLDSFLQFFLYGKKDKYLETPEE